MPADESWDVLRDRKSFSVQLQLSTSPLEADLEELSRLDCLEESSRDVGVTGYEERERKIGGFTSK